MKFGQLIEYNKRNIFFKNYTANEAGTVVLDLFLFFRKALHKVKESVLQLFHSNPIHYILTALKLGYNKNKLYKALDYTPRDILNFEFLEKSLGIVSPPHIEYDFSTKMFLVIYLLADQLSLSDCL